MSCTTLRRLAVWTIAAVVSSGSAGYGQVFPVSVVSSDDERLRQSTARADSLTAAQILDMVRRAVDLLGGMGAFVPADAELVALKPNITTPHPSGSGIITDARVIRAVAILVHEATPGARIAIAEGAGGWMSPALADCTDVGKPADWLVDGFETAGHRATVAELRARGIDIECVDLNFDRTYVRAPPGGGLAHADYDVAATIIDADVWINVPVAKTHGTKFTAVMKNHIGILPGHFYGWNKGSGTERRRRGIPHAPRVQDEAWVDLWSVSDVDLNVVDMIAGTEGGAFGGTPRRGNLIVAGADPVATDLVVAELMGFNPDDFEFADLAWQRGRGPGRHENIEVRGGDLEALSTRYVKAGVNYGGGEWTEQANYGMGPRRWTLLGPLDRDHTFSAHELQGLAPVPGSDGWSDVVWFGHDKIDLDTHFDDPIHCAVYAYTTFTMVRSDSVRFWLGSDEGLTVWLDGQLLYEFEGRRGHKLGQVKLPGYVEAGEHRLLVRATQSRGRYDFSFNVCEPLDDPRFAGNRYPGVRYRVSANDPRSPAARVRSEDIYDGWFSVERIGDLGRGEPLVAAQSAPDSVRLTQVATPASESLFGAVAAAAGLRRADLDSVSLATLSMAPFWMGYSTLSRPWGYPEYGPAPQRAFEWLGLRYSLGTGAKARESLKEIRGWLSLELPVVMGFDWRWFVVSGYRQMTDGIDLYAQRPPSQAWQRIDDHWWAQFPGRLRRNCPVVVVEAARGPLSASALVDSVAALALDLGLRRWTEGRPEPWGVTRRPAGLNAWDRWVQDWERLPWTAEWLAADDWSRGKIVDLGKGWLAEIISPRQLASRYFLAAAGRESDGRRRDLLRAAGEAYAAVAAGLDEDSGGLQRHLGVYEGETHDSRIDIERARAGPRRVRALERQALQALSDLLGRGPISPIQEDPLRRRDDGVRLFTWHAGFDNGSYELTYDNRAGLRDEWLKGREAEDVSHQVWAPIPEETGWQLALETTGEGYYEIRQSPAADNGWTAVVRMHDGAWNRRSHEVTITAWAVPASASP